MAPPIWQFVTEISVPANPASGYWTNVVDYVEYPCRLKFEGPDQRGNAPAVANKWKYGEDEIGADGDLRATANGSVLVADAPIGSLVGKLGGSRAAKSADGKTFVVGSYCVFELSDKERGPLYLAMNIDCWHPLICSGNVLVRISKSP